ncbi:MAG: hypothetical protein P8J32_07245 [bacterium]|jgi:plastocyanin|nr:hypothetical protein [bacterium]
MKAKHFALIAMMLALPLTGHVAEAEAIMYEETLESGDLFRSDNSSAVYYLGEDSMRYVFPDDTTYFTWYENFDDVQWVSDETLSMHQIGGIVTYRPGVSMLSIASNNKMYAVGQNGTLHPLASVDIAAQLYGMEYLEYTNELPEAFFGHYTIGNKIDLVSQFDKEASMAEAQTINLDKGLTTPTTVEITEGGFMDPTITINAGTAIKWTNALDENASVSEWDRVWGSGTLQPGESFVQYLLDVGTWHYYSNQQDRNTHEGAIIVE